MANLRWNKAQLEENMAGERVVVEGAHRVEDGGVPYIQVANRDDQFGVNNSYYSLEEDVLAYNESVTPAPEPTATASIFADAPTSTVEVTVRTIGTTLTEKVEQLDPSKLSSFLASGTLQSADTGASIRNFADLVSMKEAAQGDLTILYVANKTGN